MEKQYTLDQLLLGFRKVIDYIGEEKFEQILHGEIPPDNNTDEKSPDEILDEINDY